MTSLTQMARHTTTPARPRARRSVHAARKQRSFDAALASYVRELATGQDQPRRAR